jgi:hypothetical protein
LHGKESLSDRFWMSLFQDIRKMIKAYPAPSGDRASNSSYPDHTRERFHGGLPT